MSTPILYAMLTDDALRQISKLDTDKSFDSGFGSLYGEPSNYFSELTILHDTRYARLPVINSSHASGRMSLVFDKNHFNSAILENMTDVEMTCFLNKF